MDACCKWPSKPQGERQHSIHLSGSQFCCQEDFALTGASTPKAEAGKEARRQVIVAQAMESDGGVGVGALASAPLLRAGSIDLLLGAGRWDASVHIHTRTLKRASVLKRSSRVQHLRVFERVGGEAAPSPVFSWWAVVGLENFPLP